jgi:hypothetical protein
VVAVSGAAASRGAAAGPKGPAAVAASAARLTAVGEVRPAAAEAAPVNVCPGDALTLRADSVQRAADAALASAARLYPGVNTRGTEVMAADRSAFAGARGGEVKFLCGQRLADRTVVVQMLFPRMLPSASLSEAVVFVARFATGYRVWYIAH